MRSLAVGQGQRHPGDHHEQGEHPQTEDRPVEGDAGGGIHGTHRPERCERGQADGDRSREQRAKHHRTHDAEQPVGRRHRGARSDGPQHGGVFGPGAQLARDGLDTDEERRESGDDPEHPEGYGLGVYGSLGLGFDLRGDVDLERRADVVGLVSRRCAYSCSTVVSYRLPPRS